MIEKMEKQPVNIEQLTNCLGSAIKSIEGASKFAIGGTDFRANFLTIGREYQRMINRNITPADLNELEGVVKYLEAAQNLFEKKSQEPAPGIGGSTVNRDYYEAFSEIENGLKRLILVSLAEKYNNKEDIRGENEFAIDFKKISSEEPGMKQYSINEEYARFIGAAKENLARSGVDIKALEQAQEMLDESSSYSGVNFIKPNREYEFFNKQAPEEKGMAMVDWLPLWLRKQGYFME